MAEVSIMCNINITGQHIVLYTPCSHKVAVLINVGRREVAWGGGECYLICVLSEPLNAPCPGSDKHSCVAQ